MSHYQECIDSLLGAMSQSGFKVTNGLEEPLGRSSKKSVRFKADILYADITLGLSVDYTNLMFEGYGLSYETDLDPDISWVTLSRGLPSRDHTRLPDSDLVVGLIRFKQSEEVNKRGVQRVLEEFGRGKTIRWDEVTVRQNGAYGHWLNLEYDFLRKPIRRCNFELDITSKTKGAKKSGDLPHHNLQQEENHFCIVGDEYPLFPFSLEQADIYGMRFDWLSGLNRERFNQLFRGIPLPLNFQVSYQNGVYIDTRGGTLNLSCLGGRKSLEPVALLLNNSMNLFGQYYQGFQSYHASA